jgi:hypothetical protein
MQHRSKFSALASAFRAKSSAYNDDHLYVFYIVPNIFDSSVQLVLWLVLASCKDIVAVEESILFESIICWPVKMFLATKTYSGAPQILYIE